MESIVRVFAFIEALCHTDHLAEMRYFTTKADGEFGWERHGHLFEILRQLMHGPITPWWGRIWVVQKVILPPEVTVMHGTISAPWSMFSKAASRCFHHIHHCCAKDAENIPCDILNVLIDFSERVLDIEKMRSMRKAGITDLIHASSLPTNRASHEVSERSSLISLLRRFRNRKATDPRDKVYALLSLAQQNYTLSEVEVYTRASLESIYASASLSVLSIDVARKYRQDLPSWVPDWDAPGDFSHNERISTMSLYDTCSKYPMNHIHYCSSPIKTHGRGTAD
jgi:hypothetical protein